MSCVPQLSDEEMARKGQYKHRAVCSATPYMNAHSPIITEVFHTITSLHKKIISREWLFTLPAPAGGNVGWR